MRFSMDRHFLPCISIIIFAIQNGNFASGQDDVGYWVHRPILPPEVTSAYVRDFSLTTTESGNADFALIAGVSNRTDRDYSPFIYDHFGFIDPDSTYADPDPSQSNAPIAGKFWDIQELVGPSPVPGFPAYDQGVFSGVNSNGLVCGWFVSSTLSGEPRIPVYLDLTEPVLQLKRIPLPLDYSDYVELRADRVNEIGDILVILREDSGGSWEPYIFDTVNEIGFEVPLSLTNVVDTRFNSFRQIVGVRDDGMVIRHTVGVSTELFPELNDPGEINDSGQFAAALTVNKGRNKGDYGVRIGFGGGEERRWGPPLSAFNYRQQFRMNASGDALDQTANTDDAYYFHEGDPSISGDETFHDSIVGMVVPESDPGSVFRNSGLDESAMISERDSTGFGWIATDSYSGLNADGSSRLELYLLIPVIPSPIPGISVSPTDGLATSESGGWDSFVVQLDSEPAADVTIGISSDNTNEGTVDKPSLTFTPDNWDEAQTVTVTGVDDDPDNPTLSDDEYTIVIAPATSTDSDYDGLDPEDVSVTNLDNDGPSGGSQIYFSDDTPSNIRDRKNTFSTISVADDYDIVGLNVLLDITHSRPSDLTATLTGPDGTNVSLPTLDGFIDVSAAFSGASSQGQWTLKVRDNERDETGTLNGWSITVDY